MGCYVRYTTSNLYRQEVIEAQDYNLADTSGRYFEENDYNTEVYLNFCSNKLLAMWILKYMVILSTLVFHELLEQRKKTTRRDN